MSDYTMLAKNKYQFYLEGFDEKWSDWTNRSHKEYTNLSEGHYTFQVKSRNVYGEESQITSFNFYILPPWYRTTFAWAAYAIILIGLFGSLLRINTLRYERSKQKLEALVEKRTAEILDKTQELEQRKNEIEKQAEELLNKASQEQFDKLSQIAGEHNIKLSV